MPPCEGSDVGRSSIPAERSNNIVQNVCRLRATLGKVVHFSFVDFLLAFFFQTAFEIVDEQLQGLLAFLIYYLVAHAIFRFGEFLIRSGGVFALTQRDHKTSGPIAERTADLTRLHVESILRRA